MSRFFRSVIGLLKLSALFLYGAIDLLIERPATRVERAEWLHRFAGKMMRTMKISTRLEGKFPERGAIISNHMGYLDIMTYAMLHRVVFVSKAELAKVPLLGWMTTMSGTVYVERGAGGSAERARSGIQATAAEGIPIVFFPEGTRSRDGQVLPFSKGPFQLAVSEQVPILPLVVEGSGTALPRNSWLFGKTQDIHLRVLKAVSVDGWNLSQVAALTDSVRQRIVDELNQLRCPAAATVDKA